MSVGFGIDNIGAERRKGVEKSRRGPQILCWTGTLTFAN